MTEQDAAIALLLRRRPDDGTGSTGSLVARPGTAADEVVVIRPLSGSRAPTEILISTDGHIERVAADGGS